MESRSHLQQRGHPAMQARPSRRRVRNPRQDLEQRALARAVLSHDAQNLARLDFQVQVPQRPEIVALVMAREGPELLHVRPQAGGPARLAGPRPTLALAQPFGPARMRKPTGTTQTPFPTT